MSGPESVQSLWWQAAVTTDSIKAPRQLLPSDCPAGWAPHAEHGHWQPFALTDTGYQNKIGWRRLLTRTAVDAATPVRQIVFP